MPAAEVAGCGQTAFGRADRSLTELAADAAGEALAAAGARPQDVEALFLGTFVGLALGGQAFPAAVLAARLGLGGIPALAVEGACASGSLAFRQAVAAVRSGAVDVALVAGAEKMSGHTTATVTRTLAAANDTASESHAAGLTFPGFFALLARRYLHEYGVDRELLADVSVKARANGAANPKAHFQTPVTRAAALAGRTVADPLGLYDCSPISDGAAALLVTSADWAAAHGIEQPVDVRAVGQAGGPVSPERLESFVGLPAAAAAARSALAEARLEIGDVDVAEVHDCFTIAEWIALEDLGAFGRGEAAHATADGATRVGGALPVNPSGGLLSKGHPIGATGVAQLVELVRQLRDEADNQVERAEIGLAHNVGGTGGVAVVTVLGRAA